MWKEFIRTIYGPAGSREGNLWKGGIRGGMDEMA